MSYEMGMLLSFFFLTQVLLFSGDLAAVQSIHNLLDATALTAGHRISIEGEITEEIRSFCLEEAGAEISYVQPPTGKLGDYVVFQLMREYQPLVISNKPMAITVRRTAVVGYYA